MPGRDPILKRSYLLIPLLMVSACTVTGPADDGWENSYEWVDNGRLLSAETKTVFSTEGSKNSTVPRDANLDYDAYRQWQEAKESNSAEYRKFKQWQEFEAFDRWKERQRPE